MTQNKDHDAILIDTSIFVGHGLRLDSGLIGTLKQFRDSPVYILLPDVLKNELISHLTKKIRTSQTSLIKAANDAGSYIFTDENELEKLKEIVSSFTDPKELANTRVAQFIEDVGALEIDCDDYVSIKDVLMNYFGNNPPFSETGKKKNEFPDAIVLLAVEAWAGSKNKTVLAVSADNDWKQFCEQSKNLFYEEKLTVGLDKFNHTKAAISFIERIETLFIEGKEEFFVEKISNGLELSLDGFTPDQYAESQFYWEPDGSHGWFESFNLLNAKFKIIEATNDWIVIEGVAEITVGAEGEFTLSVLDSVDKDYVSLDTVTATTSDTFVSSILITISGNLEGDIEEIEVEVVEVLDPITRIDFGALELSPSFYE